MSESEQRNETGAYEAVDRFILIEHLVKYERGKEYDRLD